MRKSSIVVGLIWMVVAPAALGLFALAGILYWEAGRSGLVVAVQLAPHRAVSLPYDLSEDAMRSAIAERVQQPDGSKLSASTIDQLTRKAAEDAGLIAEAVGHAKTCSNFAIYLIVAGAILTVSIAVVARFLTRQSVE